MINSRFRMFSGYCGSRSLSCTPCIFSFLRTFNILAYVKSQVYTYIFPVLKIQAKVYHKIVRLESILLVVQRRGLSDELSLSTEENLIQSRKQITSLSVTPLLEAATMSLEAAYNLSISDLLHVLNEKLGLESSKLRGISLPTTCSAGSLESEVSVPW